MKIVVVGLGSMGKRRIRLLSENKDIQLIGVDSQDNRKQEVNEKYNINCYSSIQEALSEEKIDAAVISTSPLSHAAIIKECLENNLHVFTEINLVQDGYVENMKLAKEKGLVLFISSTFLYRKETQTIIEKVHEAKCPLNYIYHVGQYLPDWHPWESYNNYFIGNPKTNGCREIMAIDLPWLVTAFGSVKSVYAVKSKNTTLNINYNDNYIVTLEHENGTKGVFAVDVVARKPYRHIDVYGEQIQLSWNGTADSLVEFDVENKKEKNIIFDDASEHVEGYAAFITENPYREELKAFLNQIKNQENVPAWSFEKDKVVLDLIDKIEA
ncbi:MAG: Gfo/Idh/MocA family oxidoreductase [Paludibacteraceae bacterium]|nr:Gfo/Idh/MocA family oxidoreductase [Paludibacteraceae bacterium]HOU67668.1 Gfo/Idh/MocA family oxidoreductase [Paludibacteraceae bacterium]HQF49703.1 Gfo/Idh/MocA family oxidoreductase [Paludibacteraceae bacterium]